LGTGRIHSSTIIKTFRNQEKVVVWARFLHILQHMSQSMRLHMELSMAFKNQEKAVAYTLVLANSMTELDVKGLLVLGFNKILHRELAS